MNGDWIGFEIAKPLLVDAKVVMEWRNDVDTLKMSFHTAPKELEPFFEEFKKDYFCFPDLPPLFALYKEERVAFVRCRPVENPHYPLEKCCDIAINVSPRHRGKGLGTKILKEIQPWLASQGYTSCFAEVKVENEASVKAFDRAGFQLISEAIKFVEDTGQECRIYHYLATFDPTQSHEKKDVFIIAEAGSNWKVGDDDKSFETAVEMIETAKGAGADAIKFQVFRPETTYVENAGASGYLSDAGMSEDINDIFLHNALPYEMIPKLAERCQQNGIEFMASAFSLEDFEAIDPYVTRHKIASYEIGHTHLIRAAAESGKPLILSTGAATEEEISWAVDTFYQHGGEELTLMQCSASYPAPPESLNLNAIPWLQQRFKVPVGLSDHSADPINAALAAVALGVVVVEKHFTLDRELPGPDQAFAIEPGELEFLVSSVRETEQMLGAPVKTIHNSEQELRYFAKRGLQVTNDILEGDVFQEGVNYAILRPGRQPIGVHPRFIPEIEGKTAKKSISKGRGIHRKDWE